MLSQSFRSLRLIAVEGELHVPENKLRLDHARGHSHVVKRAATSNSWSCALRRVGLDGEGAVQLASGIQIGDHAFLHPAQRTRQNRAWQVRNGDAEIEL